MRILLFAPPWFYFYVVELARALSDQHDVTLLVDQNYEEQVAGSGVGGAFKTVQVPWYSTRRQPHRNAQSILRIAKLVSTLRPDIIHVQEAERRYLCALPFLTRYPTVFDVHSVTRMNGAEDGFLDRCKNWLIARADSVLVHGDTLKSALLRRYGIAADKVEVLPFGRFSVYGGAESPAAVGQRSRPNILFFGRIELYKGIQYLVEAEPLIESRLRGDFQITIVGEGDLTSVTPDLHRRPRYHIVNQRVPSPAPYFQSADVVAMPYVEASASAVTPVAYAYGKPVVVTDVGSLPESVEEGQTGYIVSPRDASHLADALVRLLQDPVRAGQMGERGRRKLDTDLAWKRNMDQVERCYATALSGRTSI